MNVHCNVSICKQIDLQIFHCQTNAKVCDAVIREITIFIMGTEAHLEAELQKYDAPPEAVEAKLEVKRCVDENLNVIEKGGMIAILVCSFCFLYSEGHK
uniref:Uncharacterized protein n=1 Tax=Peromyscus maniculatus bairdii TaxID=230844 RepID=A0A8C8UM03_PERMB